MSFSFPETRTVAIAVALTGTLLTGCGGSSSGSDSGSASAGNGKETSVVEQKVTGDSEVTLSWVAPSRRVNGDQLSYQSEINGYIILYGRNPASLGYHEKVSCKALECGHTIDGLAPGTWYFAVQTQDNAGLVSAPSAPVSASARL